MPTTTRPRSAPDDPSYAESLFPQRFRQVMAGVASPVSVITAMADGVPHGTTVSAFTSLSMTPPMVAACLDRESGLLAMVRTTGYFGVNVLNAGQAELASAFARKGGAAKFEQIEWAGDHGLPRLPGAAWLACRVTRLVEGGDHLIALGTVLAADGHDGDPLVYHGRSFGTHLAMKEPA